MRASHRALSGLWVLALPFVAFACAKGGGGSSTRHRDSGAVHDASTLDSGRGDSSSRDSGLRDSGRADTGPACVDDAIPDDCEGATELGSLDVGGVLSAMGKLPTLVDEDWYVLDVPSGFSADAGGAVDGGAVDGGAVDGGAVDGGAVDGAMFGPGTPRVELVSGDATMVMEIRMRCTAALACNGSTARELLEWSFVDDQSAEGAGAFSTRDVAWPERVYIKVSRRGGPATCEDYTLNITR